MAWHGVSAGVCWHFSGLPEPAFSVLAFAVFHFTVWPCFWVLWVARVVSSCFSVAYACAFICDHSFTLLRIRGVFVDCVFFSVSPPSSPCSFSFFSFSTPVQGDGCLAWGWILAGRARGWVAGRANLWGVLPAWTGLAVPAPRYLSIQPPFATQVSLGYYFILLFCFLF